MSDSTEFLRLQRSANTLRALDALAGRGGGDPLLELNGHLFAPRGAESLKRIQREQAALFSLLDGAEERAQGVIAFNLGCLALSQDDILSAKLRFSEAARLMPEDAAALHNLAVAQELMADFDLAQEALLRALELDPGSELSRLNLALIHREEGDTEEALRLLRDQAKAHPGNPGPLLHLCRTLLARGTEEDSQEIKQLLEDNAGWEQATEIRECLGRALLRLADFEGAAQLFREILAEGRPRPSARIGLIKALAAGEKLEELLEQAQLHESEFPSPEVADIIEQIKAL